VDSVVERPAASVEARQQVAAVSAPVAVVAATSVVAVAVVVVADAGNPTVS
jgi:hypothetical protein